MKTLISCKCCFSGPLFSRPGQLQWEATSRLNRDKLISVVQGCTVGVYWSLKWPLFARHDWTCNTPFFVRPYWWDVWWFGSVSKVCGIPLITISTRFKQRGAMWRRFLDCFGGSEALLSRLVLAQTIKSWLDVINSTVWALILRTVCHLKAVNPGLKRRSLIQNPTCWLMPIFPTRKPGLLRRPTPDSTSKILFFLYQTIKLFQP